MRSLLLLPLLLAASSVDENAAMSAWLARDLTVASAENALTLLQQVADAKGDSLSWVRVSAAAYWLALIQTEAGLSDATRKASFELGETAAQRASKINPSDPGGPFWEAVNGAKVGEINGVVSSVWRLPKLTRLIRRTDELEPFYFYGGTDRARGVIITKTPEWLVILKGSSLEEGEQLYAASLTQGPELAATKVFWSDLKVRRGDIAGAIRLLTEVINASPSDDLELRAWNQLEKVFAARKLKALTSSSRR